MGPDPRNWSARQLASVLDHTLLTPTATSADIERTCAEAREHVFASVCVNGVHVRRCSERLQDSPVRVCSVLAFPLGSSHPAVKVQEAGQALRDGAHELDMVLQIGALRAGEHAFVADDIAGVVTEAHRAGALVKVILEVGLLTRDEIVMACRLAEAAGAAFVKTGTGSGRRGATRADVELLRASVGAGVGVKAAGGIRTAQAARELLAAGATRLGTSASLVILREAARDA